jgi:hypothetical protein
VYVCVDVRKIIPEELLSDEMAGGFARLSNLKNAKVVSTPSGNKAVLTAVGEVDATRYVDPKTGAVFSIDHLTLVTRVPDSLRYTLFPYSLLRIPHSLLHCL